MSQSSNTTSLPTLKPTTPKKRITENDSKAESPTGIKGWLIRFINRKIKQFSKFEG